MAKSEAPKTTAITTWDEELAAEARVAAGIEQNAVGGNFFKTKSGVLTWQDQPLKNNEVAAIILDSVLENVYYEGDFDADNPTSPVCFAFGRDEAKLMPHLNVIQAKQAQHMDGDTVLGCVGCERNAWGSADKGKGKACKNVRRLALISAGSFNEKTGAFEIMKKEAEEYFKTTQVGFLKLPVTSVKGYASFVTQIAGSLQRPPFGIITRVKLVPDAKSQFKVTFEPLQKVPDSLMGIIIERNKAVKSVIEFPYQLGGEEGEATPKTKAAKPDRSAPSVPPKGKKGSKY